MNKSKKPFLISPLHDPEAKYLPLIKKSASSLPDFYSLVILGVSQETSPKTTKKLRSLGYVIRQGNYPYGEAHRQALADGLKRDGKIFHCSDFDRILHWVSSYPEELEKTLKKAKKADYVIVGRTRKAFATHPRSWQMTEKIDNVLLSKILGFKVDPYAGAAILNREAAEIIVAQSKEIGFPILAEWPLLIKKAGLKIDGLEVEGHEWEDPDRFQKEIKKMGFPKWLESYDSLDEWKKRAELTRQRIQFLSERPIP